MRVPLQQVARVDRFNADLAGGLLDRLVPAEAAHRELPERRTIVDRHPPHGLDQGEQVAALPSVELAQAAGDRLELGAAEVHDEAAVQGHVKRRALGIAQRPYVSVREIT